MEAASSSDGHTEPPSSAPGPGLTQNTQQGPRQLVPRTLSKFSLFSLNLTWCFWLNSVSLTPGPGGCCVPNRSQSQGCTEGTGTSVIPVVAVHAWPSRWPTICPLKSFPLPEPPHSSQLSFHGAGKQDSFHFSAWLCHHFISPSVLLLSDSLGRFNAILGKIIILIYTCSAWGWCLPGRSTGMILPPAQAPSWHFPALVLPSLLRVTQFFFRKRSFWAHSHLPVCVLCVMLGDFSSV